MVFKKWIVTAFLAATLLTPTQITNPAPFIVVWTPHAIHLTWLYSPYTFDPDSHGRIYFTNGQSVNLTYAGRFLFWDDWYANLQPPDRFDCNTTYTTTYISLNATIGAVVTYTSVSQSFFCSWLPIIKE